MNEFAQEAHAEAIADELRMRVLAGELQPGDRFVQERLAREFEVSRIPMREVLRTLQAEGLARSRPGGGLFVATLRRAEVEELYALRISIEPPLASDIIAGCGPRDFEMLANLAEEMTASSSSPERRGILNYRFHVSMYQLAARPLTLRIIKQLLHLGFSNTARWMLTADQVQSICQEHDEMMLAIREKDAELLETGIRKHIAAIRDRARLAMQATVGEENSTHVSY